MRHIAITARRGAGKHMNTVLGRPIVEYPILAASLADAATKTVWTDCPSIGKVAMRFGVSVKGRPEEMNTDRSPHHKIIEYLVRQTMQSDEDYFIVLLGNTASVCSALIDRAFDLLENECCNSIMTVWRAQDDHPLRAITVNDKGFAVPYGPPAVTSNRQSYPPVWFFDQGIWGFRAHCALEKRGPAPWVWLGDRCLMLERPWVTGRDTHTGLDVPFQGAALSAMHLIDDLGALVNPTINSLQKGSVELS